MEKIYERNIVEMVKTQDLEQSVLFNRIKNLEAKVGIIGLGYVGLPLAVEFASVGYMVTGFEINEAKVNALKSSKSYVIDISDGIVESLIRDGRLEATADFSRLMEQDTVNICVPTPLRKTKDPDVSYIVQAVDEISKYLHREQLIILESTTYPGTTAELILPMLTKTGLKVGEDFYLAFSPERVDPGNKEFTTKNIPKVVGGMTPKCTAIAVELYKKSLDHVVPVSSTQVAEMVKLLENTFRSVNIGMVNELACMCQTLGIDVWEVIDAAATKPFGFMPFYPGPGLGGHCIPIDPFYLSWKARQSGFEARFIELAGHVNSAMPRFVAEKVADALNDSGKCVKGSRVLILGVAYKRDIDDLRESPALDIIKDLQKKGAVVSYHDNFFDTIREDGTSMASLPLTGEVLRESDCVVIVTDHSYLDKNFVVENAPLIVDTRNALKGFRGKHIYKL